MRILVSAESFGYGPITTCLNVMKELKVFPNVVLDFIGSGISLEQAKLSKYFQTYYNCDTFDFSSLEKNKDVFKKYDIFVSSENVNGAIFALKNNINNTYYIDNLMWMWDKIPTSLNNVKKYFISEIIPSKENFERIGKQIKNPVFVGPIREIDINSEISSNQLIINIGGAESFLLNHDLISKFYNRIINDILSSEELQKFSKIIICGGSKVLKNVILENKNQNVEKVTLSHEEYLKEMKKSSHCILASGLGNFIETIGKDKHIMYLPAINYSQLLQLEYYSNQQFGFKNLNWTSFDFYNDIPKYLDEETGVDLVVSNIKKFLDGNYKKFIQSTIKNFIYEDQNKYFNIRKDYIRSFPKDASKVIARTIFQDNE